MTDPDLTESLQTCSSALDELQLHLRAEMDSSKDKTRTIPHSNLKKLRNHVRWLRKKIGAIE